MYNFLKKILIIIATLLFSVLLYKISDIITILFFSLFLTLLFSKFLNTLNKHKIPDILGIILIYSVIILLIIIAFSSIIPIFIEQSSILFGNISDITIKWNDLYKAGGINALPIPEVIKPIITKGLGGFDLSNLLELIKNNFSSISKIISEYLDSIRNLSQGILTSVTSSIFLVGMIIIFNIFCILERKQIAKVFYTILPIEISKYLKKRECKIQTKLYKWIKGQFILAFLMFSIAFIMLFIISIFYDINSIFSLALIAGLMEFIPIIGPLLAFIPALAIAGNISFGAVITISIAYILLQQIEGNVLVPWIYGNTLNVSPFFVLLMMTVGGVLYGIVGIMLAVPIASILNLFYKDWKKKYRK